METVRRELDSELAGRRIRRVRVYRPDIVLEPRPPGGLATHLEGLRIREVARRGKSLLFRLESGREPSSRMLQVQLRMTGRFALGRSHREGSGRADGNPQERADGSPSERGSGSGAEPADAAALGLTHLAAELELDDGRTLFYDDVRRLGGFRLLTEAEWNAVEARLGPEPLSEEFTARRLGSILDRSRAPVKNLLLNQRRVAGIGNIYANEALHLARIGPARPARELDAAETGRLHRAIRRVLREATRAAGTTLRDFRAVNGRSGQFQSRLRVYGRAGLPCPRCGTTILRTVQAGRSTFHCPACQS